MASGGTNIQAIHIPLDGGIDQRTRPEWVQPPGVLDSVNTRFRQVGGVEKRPGLVLVANQWADSTAIRQDGTGKLIPYRSGLLLTDGFKFGPVASVNGTTAPVPLTDVPDAVAYESGVASTNYAMGAHDVAYAMGLEFHVWTPGVGAESDKDVPVSETGGVQQLECIYVSVISEATRTHLVAAQLLSTSSLIFGCPRVLAIGNVLHVYYRDNAGNIWLRIWNHALRSFAAATAVITDNDTGGADDMDFDVATDGTSVFLVYKTAANALKIKLISTAGTVTASITSTEASTSAREFGICATAGEVVWISYVTGTGAGGSTRLIRAAVYTLTLGAESVAPFTVVTETIGFGTPYGTAICRRTATTATIIYAMGPGQSRSFKAPVVSTAGAVVGSASAANRTTAWASPASKPFQPDPTTGRVLAWAYVGGAAVGTLSSTDQPQQYTMILVDVGSTDTSVGSTQLKPVTGVAPRLTSKASYLLPSVISTATNVWVTSVASHATNAGRMRLSRVTAEFAHPGHLTSSELGQTLFVAPGVFWDGATLAEISYCYWPQKPGLNSTTNGAGSLTNSATYRWKVVFEWVDALGFIHRSQPSDYLEATLGGTDDTAIINVPCLCVTRRPGTSIRLALYRTNGTDQNTYYLTTNATANDPTTSSVLITDLMSDATLAVQEQLYTLGGVIPNVQPPSFTAMTTYRNRIWIAYGNTVAYSKAFVTGETVSFTDAFTLPLEEAGDITALWVQDDTLYIATANRIYFVAGDGPTDLGTQNDIGTPNRVATDRGVADPRSVVVNPLGTMYRSSVGIQQLDRGRSVSPEPIGARIQSLLDAFPVVTSAIVHPTGAYTTFTCNAEDGASGIRLVHDYTADKWSRDLLFEGGGEGVAVRSACNLDGVQYVLIGGSVYSEDAIDKRDAGAWVTMRVYPAEIHPAGLQGNTGFVRWTFLAQKAGSHDLVMSWFRNYEASAFYSDTATSDEFLTTVEQISRVPPVMRAQSMRVTIADATPTGGGGAGNGQGPVLIALAVEVDSLDNKAFRLPAAQKG